MLSIVCLTAGYAQNKAKTSKKDKSTTTLASDTTKQLVNIPASSTIPSPKKDWSKVNFNNRANDHFMLQFGSDQWLNKPAWVNTGGFSRHFNFYLMLDKPFKTNPHFSTAYGLGLTCNNIFFSNQSVDLNRTDSVQFDNSLSNRYKKFKLTTMYLTVPVEIRYFTDPINPNKSWKFAAGAKVGLLVNSYTKGKNLLDQNGNSQFGASYTKKEYNSSFFDSYLFSLTGRIGWGNFSLNADYHITTVFKDGFGPAVHPLSIGLTISGL